MPRKKRESKPEAAALAGGPEASSGESAPTQRPSGDDAEGVSLAAAENGPPRTGAGLRAARKKAANAGLAVTGAAQGASETAARAIRSTGARGTARAKSSLQRATTAAIDLVSTSQGLLASNLATDLNDLMQGMVQGTATIYDKAMDATYIATHEGGANHRLFDGGHTLSGAVSAGHNASADDGIIQEAIGTLQGLLRDGTTPKGLPIVTWDKTTFEQVADALQSHLHIPKDWFRDLNTYDAAELLGSTVGVVAMALNWSRADTEGFAKLAGNMGLSSALAANPALLVVTVVALARAFQKARQTGDYAALVDGQVKGAIGTGSALAAVSLVGVAGGPAGVALLAGLAVGILANQATQKVSVVQLSEAVAANAKMAAQQAKAAGATLRGRGKGRGRMKLPLPGPGRRRSPESPDAPALSNPG